jgi:hypothetical protein
MKEPWKGPRFETETNTPVDAMCSDAYTMIAAPHNFFFMNCRNSVLQGSDSSEYLNNLGKTYFSLNEMFQNYTSHIYQYLPPQRSIQSRKAVSPTNLQSRR